VTDHQHQPCDNPTSPYDQMGTDNHHDRCTRCRWILSEHEALKPVRIGLDVGGVLSKYPYVFRALLRACAGSGHVEWHIVSDMHPKEEILTMLALNEIDVPAYRVHSADFAKYGEACKVILAKELRLSMMIDDFGAYVAEGDLARLLVMPNIRQPYYHDHWKVPPPKDGKFSDFGRRKKLPLDE
jgi:hypothetical protein